MIIFSIINKLDLIKCRNAICTEYRVGLAYRCVRKTKWRKCNFLVLVEVRLDDIAVLASDEIESFGFSIFQWKC